MFIALCLSHCLLRTHITQIFHVLNLFIACICILSPNNLNLIELNILLYFSIRHDTKSPPLYNSWHSRPTVL